MALPRLFTGVWNGHWSISLQSNQRLSGCALTSKDIRSLTSTHLHARDSDQRPFRCSHTEVCMLVTSTANMSTGVTTKHPLMVRAWTPAQHPTTLDCCMTQRKQSVSPLTDRMSAPTQTWPSRVSAMTADCETDLIKDSSCGHNIGPPSKRHQDSRFLAHSDPVSH